MKNLIFKPYLDAVKLQIKFLDGDEDNFDLSGLGGDGKGGKKEENEKEENEKEGDSGDASSEDGTEGENQSKESDEGKEGEGSEGDEKEVEGGDGSSDGDDESGDDGKSKEGDDGASGDEGDDGGAGEKGEGENGDGKDGKDGDDGKGAAGDGGEESEDFFSDINTEEDNGVVEDFNPLATDLGFELKDPKSRIEFVEKVNGQIKEAQQKLDLSEYNDTSQRLINFANKGGDVTDFFTNTKINQYNSFLSSTPETKFNQVRRGALAKEGLDAEAISTKVNEELDEMSTRELKDITDGYNDEIEEARNNEIVSLLGDKETQMAAAKTKAESAIEKEKQSLIKYVETQDDFMGIQLTEANKKGIINSINNGTFDLAVEKDPAASKFTAFMFTKFYEKFVQQSKADVNNENRSGYNKGLNKGKGTAYNQETKNAGAKGSGGKKERWHDLLDMED